MRTTTRSFWKSARLEVRASMTAREVGQSELSRSSGVSRQSINRFLQNHSTLTAESLERLRAALAKTTNTGAPK